MKKGNHVTEFGQDNLRRFTFLKDKAARQKCKVHVQQIETKDTQIQKYARQSTAVKIEIGNLASAIAEELENCTNKKKPTKAKLFQALFEKRKNRIDECIARFNARRLGLPSELGDTAQIKLSQYAAKDEKAAEAVKKIVEEDQIKLPNGKKVPLSTAKTGQVGMAIKHLNRTVLSTGKKSSSGRELTGNTLENLKGWCEKFDLAATEIKQILKLGKAGLRKAKEKVAEGIRSEIRQTHETTAELKARLEKLVPDLKDAEQSFEGDEE